MKKYYTDIIVGAGSSGCVIASRISENSSRNVLLVEAGPDYPDIDSTPATLRNGLTPDLSTHSWGYSIHGNSKLIHAPRGKVVGGSSSINTCVAVRAEKSDMKDWNTLADGNWSWEEILNSYKSIENDLDFGGQNHGNNGPVKIRRWSHEEVVPISKAFLRACKEKKFNYLPNFNKPSTTGAGIFPMNIVDGLRQSSSICFINPIRKRNNLTILPDTLVDKVTFLGNHAKGIIAINKKGKREIEGERVILCTGAYATPLILMRSGIGEKNDLAKYGIKLVANLPGVGKNLMDHPMCYITIATKKGIHNSKMPSHQVVLKFTSSRSKYVNDMQLSILNWVELTRFAPEIAKAYKNPDVFVILIQIEHTLSRGNVIIQDVNPSTSPFIALDYCSKEYDMTRLREGIRLAYNMLKTQALSPYSEIVFELNENVLRNNEKLNKYIKAHVLTSHHPMGTSQMGKKTNPNAVVDNQCQVIGTQQLFVADASVIPIPIRANPNLTCMAIGDKIGKQLKQKYDYA